MGGDEARELVVEGVRDAWEVCFWEACLDFFEFVLPGGRPRRLVAPLGLEDLEAFGRGGEKVGCFRFRPVEVNAEGAILGDQ